MKIGIITFFRLANYGANLQAFSSFMYLTNHGHEVLFIDWEPDDYYKTKVEKAISDNRSKHHFEFVDYYLPKTKRCITDEDICHVINEERIDAIIIGSDAVLQNHPLLERTIFPSKHILTILPPNSATTYPSPFWGSFIDKMSKQIPVAVMSGSSQDSKYFFIRGRERKKMGESIMKFVYFSVRDTWTQKMIQYLTLNAVKPDITPDPVFALRENAKNILPTKEVICEKYKLPDKYALFSFWNNTIVSYEWLKEIGDLFKANGITPVAFPMPGGVNFNHPYDIVVDTPTPLDWYSIIANASAYIGEKMHPIVTCLSNSVPCFNFDHCGVKFLRNKFRYSKSSKIYHIMKEFDVIDNRVNGSGLCYKSPTPRYVYEKIMSFDVAKCQRKSEHYLEEYNKMMTTIFDKINKA